MTENLFKIGKKPVYFIEPCRLLFKMLHNDKIHDIMIKIEFIQYERSLYDESILQSDV